MKDALTLEYSNNDMLVAQPLILFLMHSLPPDVLGYRVWCMQLKILLVCPWWWGVAPHGYVLNLVTIGQIVRLEEEKNEGNANAIYIQDSAMGPPAIHVYQIWCFFSNAQIFLHKTNFISPVKFSHCVKHVSQFLILHHIPCSSFDNCIFNKK